MSRVSLPEVPFGQDPLIRWLWLSLIGFLVAQFTGNTIVVLWAMFDPATIPSLFLVVLVYVWSTIESIIPTALCAMLLAAVAGWMHDRQHPKIFLYVAAVGLAGLGYLLFHLQLGITGREVSLTDLVENIPLLRIFVPTALAATVPLHLILHYTSNDTLS